MSAGDAGGDGSWADLVGWWRGQREVRALSLHPIGTRILPFACRGRLQQRDEHPLQPSAPGMVGSVDGTARVRCQAPPIPVSPPDVPPEWREGLSNLDDGESVAAN
jgi:hypothetical protein